MSFSTLGESCDVAALAATRAQRWSPGRGAPAHSEIFASTRDACGAGLALALARDGLRAVERSSLDEVEDRRNILWVQDISAIKACGRPYRHGLPRELRHRLIHVEAKSAEDALFALEEGLRCRDIAFIVGEILGNPRALDFTASRRLSLAAERHGVPLWLVRLDADADLSSARMRWKVVAEISPPARWDETAPGIPSWAAELFRARTHIPGEWILHDDGGCLVAADPASAQGRAATPHYGGLVRAAAGRSLAAV